MFCYTLMRLKVNIFFANPCLRYIKQSKCQWLSHKRFVLNQSRKPRVAIVGTGPAGIYCGKTLVHLFRHHIKVH
jgi:hypothetical protein